MIPNPSTRWPLLAAACSIVLGGTAAAQVPLRLQRAGGAIATQGIEREDDKSDRGPAVDFYESPNLDRFVRRARQFLDEGRYADAIQVLQSVVEGRTLEAEATAPVDGAPSPEPSAQPSGTAEAEGQEAGKISSGSSSPVDVDPKQAVFSVDGRVYRPAGRLCQEYLASMPEAGIELYQAVYETAAADALAEAIANGEARALEAVVSRWFPTLAAGQALQRLADLHMHQGHYRAAVQTLRELVDLYPAANRSRLGVSVLWCRFKIALCMRLAGEVGAAHDAAAALAEAFPDESLRLMGELHPVRELPTHPLFQANSVRTEIATRSAVGSIGWLDDRTEALLPLWLYRFAGPSPYEATQPKRDNNGSFFFGSSVATVAAPSSSRYGVGTQVLFSDEHPKPARVMFLENFRLRVADAFTGVLQVDGDGEAVPAKPIEGRARPRVPVYDLALATPVEDESRIYAVLGYNRVTQNNDPLSKNEIVAYRKPICERVWTTQDWLEGTHGLADVVFLAAPTVFGERLLTPVLRNGAYGLQCLDRSSGKPLWYTRIHAGGSEFFKAPGSHVKVDGNVAYVLTNAGAVAAIDAFAGDLRWARKYERQDSGRKRPARRRGADSTPFGYGVGFVEKELETFLPSELLVEGGTVLFAGCDSEMLTCLDSSNGEVVWMLDGTTRYAPYGRMSHIVGSDGNLLFVEAKGDLRNQLVCIEKASGIVRWAQEIPRANERLTNWPGRGCLVGDFVVLPGDRELLVLDAAGVGPWRRLALPALGLGDEPFAGPNNIYCSGPFVAVCYARGIEVFSSVAALQALAEATPEPLERADFLVMQGRIEQALEVVLAALAAADATPAQREDRLLEAIALAREVGSAGDGDPLASLERVRPFAFGKKQLLALQLACLDVCRARGDTTRLDEQQQILYRLMEGKK